MIKQTNEWNAIIKMESNLVIAINVALYTGNNKDGVDLLTIMIWR